MVRDYLCLVTWWSVVVLVVTPLIPRAVCPECGFIFKYVEDLDSHDLHCHGPVRLVFTENGVIYGEVGSE